MLPLHRRCFSANITSSKWWEYLVKELHTHSDRLRRISYVVSCMRNDCMKLADGLKLLLYLTWVKSIQESS